MKQQATTLPSVGASLFIPSMTLLATYVISQMRLETRPDTDSRKQNYIIAPALTLASVKDTRRFDSSIHRRMYCCQSEKAKKQSKASKDPKIKNRETIGMDRFDCDGYLGLSCRSSESRGLVFRVMMTHAHAHVQYQNVSMPSDALEFIQANLNTLPHDLHKKLSEQHPDLTQAQVYATWKQNAEILWKRDEDPLQSGSMLLQEWEDDVDIFNLSLPEGVTALGWGVKRVSNRISGMVVEIVLDATCEFGDPRSGCH
jgi:hypothetical protein